MSEILPGLNQVVSPLCLGGGAFGHVIREDESHALLDRFAAWGGNFIDTARVYQDWLPGGAGRSERIIGDWMKSRRNRHRVVVATKGGHPSLATMEVPRTSEAEIRADLDASRRALGTEFIDLYWLHRDDPSLPAAHFIELLNALVDEGSIRAFGASNWSARRLQEAADHARRSGLRNFSASQPRWCLGCQHARPSPFPGLVVFDAEAHRFHTATGMPVIPYGSQAGGFYAKLVLSDGLPPQGLEKNPYHTPAGLAAGRVVAQLAEELAVTPAAIVLAYLWSRPFPVVPVVGCRTIWQLEDSAAAVSLRLDAEQLRRLETASQSGLG